MSDKPIRYSDEAMLKSLQRNVCRLDTICDVHSKVYQEVKDLPDNQKVIDLLIISQRMAKKMSAKLKWYKDGMPE